MNAKTMLTLVAALLTTACSTASSPASSSTDTSPPQSVAAVAPQNPTEEAPMQQPDNTLMRVLSGEVFYRERIALPKGAVVTVELQDQSRMDAPATVLTTYEHIVDGAPPYSFRLVYDPKSIDERGRYGLRARIEYQGELLFTSTEHIDPFGPPRGERISIQVRSAR